MLHICPTDVVHAPAEGIWRLVSRPSELVRWTDTSWIPAGTERTRPVGEVPDRELRAGDRLVRGAGIGHRLTVVFEVRDTVPPRRLALHIRLPFGVTNDEVIEIAPLGAEACRVTFN